MNLIERIEAAPAAFDYSELSDDVAARQRDRATKIIGIYRKTVEAAGEIGRELLAAQEELEHGQFLRWVEGALGLSKSAAYRAMDVARSFGDKLPTVGTLPIGVVYKLAEKSTPEPARRSVIERIEAGTAPAPEAILEEVREAKEAARRQAAEEKEAARRAALSPEDRAAEDARNKRRGSRRAAEEARLKIERAERKRVEAARTAQADEAAREILARFGLDDAAQFLARFQEIESQIFGRLSRQVLIDLARRTEPVEVELREIYETGAAYAFQLAISEEDQARIDELATDIKQNGLREPLILQERHRSSHLPYQILDGAYRYQALRQLRRATAPAYIAPPLG